MKTIPIAYSSWIALGFAILFGVFGTIAMKLSDGLRKPVMAFYVGLFYALSFAALTFVIKYMDISVIYAIWSGVGTFLVSMIGIFYFKEHFSFNKMIFLFLIIIGVIGIPLSAYLS